MTARTIDILSRRFQGGWMTIGDTIIAMNGQPVPTVQEIEAARASVEAEMEAEAQAATVRPAARAALRAQWDSLPAWIRGPYSPLFDSANALLDAGDDEAAEAMIQYAAPMPAYNAQQVATFEAVRTQFAAGIAALP